MLEKMKIAAQLRETAMIMTIALCRNALLSNGRYP
jgi:hypothetical protein